MRMFLVGMCDIFLILYLTTLSHVDPRLVSELTVEDYYEIKKSEEEVRSLLDQRKTELERVEEELGRSETVLREKIQRISGLTEEKMQALMQLKNSENILKRLREDVNLLEEEKTRALELANKASQEKKDTAKSLDEVKRNQQELAKLLEERNKLLKETEEREAKAASRVEKLAAEIEKAKIHSAEVESLLERIKEREDEALAEAEKLREREASARRSEEEALREAERAREEASQARDRENEALVLAKQAKETERATRTRALRIAREAAQARTRASEATERAAEAAAEARTTRKKISIISQPAKKAFSENVKERLVSLRIKSRIKNILLGTSTDEPTVTTIPVEFSQKNIVFVRRNQAGLNLEISPSRVKEYKITAGGLSAKELIVNPEVPEIVGVVLAVNKHNAANPRLYPTRITDLMPMLIAVRSQNPTEFRDRIRDIKDVYFVFKRDRLHFDKAGLLVYQSRGIRGTKDFAQTILEGDQIVDLEGAFVGIALRRNTILPISTVKDWRVIPLEGKSGREVFEAVRAVLGSDT